MTPRYINLNAPSPRLRTPSTSITKIMVSSSVLGFPRIGMSLPISDEYRSDTAQVPTVRLKRPSRPTGQVKSLPMISRRLLRTSARPPGPRSRIRASPTSPGTRFILRDASPTCAHPDLYSGEFSLYDHVLDHSAAFNVIPARYQGQGLTPLDTFFAMGRGRQADGVDVPASEMKKW